MASNFTDRLRNAVLPGYGAKTPVLCASTGNVTLTGATLSVFDGVTPSSGDRLLVWQQNSTRDNGIYIHPGSTAGTWTRDSDFSGNTDVAFGTLVHVATGTNFGGKTFRVASTGSGSNGRHIFTGSSTSDNIVFRVADLTGAGFLNVKTFGAKGDGSTADAAAVARAITAANASSSPLYFPAGTYILVGEDLAGGMIFFGDGKTETVLKKIEDGQAHLLRCSASLGCEIRDMTVNYNFGATSGSTSNGVAFRINSPAGSIYCENVKFTGGGATAANLADGVYIDSSGPDFRFVNCDGVSNGRSGLAVVKGVNVKVDGGNWNDNGLCGQNFEGTNFGDVQEMQITGAHAEGNLSAGFSFAERVRRGVLTNYVSKGNQHGVSIGQLSSGIVVSDGSVFSNRRHGVLIQNAANDGAVTNNVFLGNGASSTGAYGDIYLDGSTYGGTEGGRGWHIAGNTGRAPGSTGLVYGIAELNGAGGNRIVGNDFHGHTTPYQLAGSSTAPVSVFFGNRSGSTISASNGNIIPGSIFPSSDAAFALGSSDRRFTGLYLSSAAYTGSTVPLTNAGNLMPSTDATHSLGSSTGRFTAAYVSSAVYAGSTKPLLHDRGTYSPVLRWEATNSTNTYVNQEGQWSQVADVMTVWIDLALSAKDSGSTQQLVIDLPKISAASGPRGGAFVHTWQGVDLDVAGSYYAVGGQVVENSSFIYLHQMGDAVSAAALAMANMSTVASIRCVAVYPTTQ